MRRLVASRLRQAGPPVGVGRYLRWGGQPQPGGLRACLTAGANVELSQDRGDVMVDRFRRYDQALGDLGVTQAVCHEGEHLELARREAGRVRACLRARSSWPDSAMPQALPPANAIAGVARAPELPRSLDRRRRDRRPATRPRPAPPRRVRLPGAPRLAPRVRAPRLTVTRRRGHRGGRGCDRRP
jgi:hypothetical protein